MCHQTESKLLLLIANILYVKLYVVHAVEAKIWVSKISGKTVTTAPNIDQFPPTDDRS